MTIAVLSAPLDELEVGARFVTRRRTITETDVVSFATLTGDFHPHHVDAEWAKASAFGERIAHGMLILSYAVGLVPLDPERVLALRGVRDVVFKRPVRLGDTIHVEGRLESIALIDSTSGLAAWQWNVLNQEQRVVTRATLDVLWSRSAARA